MKLAEIAERLGCTLNVVTDADGEIEIRDVATIEEAGEGDLTFFVNKKYVSHLKSTRASALIVGLELEHPGRPLLRHSNPYLTFAKALELFRAVPEVPADIHASAVVSESAVLGQGVSIGPFCYVGDRARLGDRVRLDAHVTVERDCEIGSDTHLHSSAVIRERVTIGARCVIQSQAVIGSDGFGFAKQDDGSWYRILQAGSVVLEDDVDIGAGTTIDRPAIGATVIGKGTKIDNLVQVGHACRTGSNCLICAQTGLAGSTILEDDVILAGQVGSSGHLTVGKGAIVTAQAGIPGYVQPGSRISGSPAFDNRDWLRSTAAIVRLPQLQRSVRELKEKVEALEIALNKHFKSND